MKTLISSLLEKRNLLLAYSSSAACFLATKSGADAQIVYVDDPDTLINVNDESYVISDAGMGTAEVTFMKSSYLNSGTGPEGYPYYYRLNKLSVIPGSVSVAGYYLPVIVYKGMPFVINAGEEIGSALSWINGDSSTSPFYLAWYRKLISTSGYNVGHFGSWDMGVNNKYVGFRFQTGADNHYGWIRLSVINESNYHSALIKDFAYQLTPNTPIIAGDMGSPDTGNTALNENDLPGDILIYSHYNSIFINTGQENDKEYTIQIYDLGGNQIYYENATGDSREIRLNDIAAGFYICRLTLNDEVVTKKVEIHSN